MYTLLVINNIQVMTILSVNSMYVFIVGMVMVLAMVQWTQCSSCRHAPYAVCRLLQSADMPCDLQHLQEAVSYLTLDGE